MSQPSPFAPLPRAERAFFRGCASPVFSRRLPLFAACLLLGVALAGCGGAQRGASTSSARVSGGARGAISLFSPMERSGAIPVSAAEAESLSLKMEKRVQRLGSWKELAFPVSQSLAVAAARPADGVALNMPGLRLTNGQMAATLRHLESLLPRLDSAPGLLSREFAWYRIGPDFGLTGYYEPTLRASRKKSSAFPYPLYRCPPELTRGKRYHTRNAIDRKGALGGRGLEIAWVSSEVDAFFLHIQGSGRLLFEDGSVSHVLFAGTNSCAYVPLGRVMKERGLLDPDNVSMQSIREVLDKNPKLTPELLDTNPSYIFFREAPQGPIGAMGKPLTPWVSTAVDRKVLPHGLLTFLVVPLPDNTGYHNRPFYGLTLPQDTGGAIKNNRVDLFCGPGDLATQTAGYLNTRGAVYILVKK